jgi:hypothetical protein
MQTRHKEELASFACRWATEPHADASISNMQNHATVFEIDRTVISLGECVLSLYIENMTPANWQFPICQYGFHEGSSTQVTVPHLSRRGSRPFNSDLAAE